MSCKFNIVDVLTWGGRAKEAELVWTKKRTFSRIIVKNAQVEKRESRKKETTDHGVESLEVKVHGKFG